MATTGPSRYDLFDQLADEFMARFRRGERPSLQEYDLAETSGGFSFEATTLTKGMIYDLDKEGRRIQPGRPWSGTTVVRYEIGERASTKRLTGFSRILSTTIKDSRPTGLVRIVTKMRLSDGQLTLEETRPGYADAPAAGGAYKPYTSNVKTTLSLEGGKLRDESHVAYFDVDPDTFERSPSPVRTVTTVSTEIADR
jgi:hypothetical protein